jgi:hypothetical protein
MYNNAHLIVPNNTWNETQKGLAMLCILLQITCQGETKYWIITFHKTAIVLGQGQTGK